MSRSIWFECPDISSYQGNVNFKALRDAGYPAVIMRAGWGQNNRDPKYASNAQACVNLGIPAAIYWFSYALNDRAVLREAEYAIKAAEEYWTDAPIAFDLEYDSRRYAATKGVNMDIEMITRHAILFLRAVREAGHRPILYTNRDYWRHYFDIDKIQAEVGDVSIWFAYYSGNEPAEVEKSDIWQYTSKAAVPGISGKCDLNRVYTNIFAKACTPAPTEPTTNLYIKSFQEAANLDGYRDQYGHKLAEDGIDGPKTQYARKKICLKAKRTLWGWQMGSTGAVVRWIQQRCAEILGINLVVDGKYGAATRAAVIRLQRKRNLTVDGIAGYNTIQACFYN